ncbi:hypothetical protein G7Y89_g834 [Cudoniella acicularis]|uniref:Uncharacterized protein n=1 Tax=Cudoniella acicularis TaxID=354080 RepID=A0A8H4WA30_9HELO|nr:hypothetical protein G7Y89_g834 [Cudoniella acicularis]
MFHIPFSTNSTLCLYATIASTDSLHGLSEHLRNCQFWNNLLLLLNMLPPPQCWLHGVRSSRSPLTLEATRSRAHRQLRRNADDVEVDAIGWVQMLRLDFREIVWLFAVAAMALPTGMAAAGKSLQDSSPSAPIDLWGKALNHVNKDKKIALDGSLDGKREIVNDVLSLVRAAEQTCQQKRWKWKNRRGGSVILRDVFAKMVTWVQKFKDMGDIIVQYDPAHASIPWGVARFAIVSDFQANGAMLECLELVFNLITKFEIVECLYLRKPSSLAKQLEQSIISMYTSVLEYLFDAYKYYSKGTFSRVINNMFQLEETTLKHQAAIKIKAEGVDEYIHLLSHEIVLNGDVMLNGIVDTLGNLNMSLQKLQGAGNQAVPVQEPSRLDTETLSRLLTDLNEPIRRMASGLKLIDDKLNGEERMKVFDWLSSTQYSSHHRSKVKDLLPGSGEWLLRKPEFKEWLASSSSSILWLHGIRL